MIVGKAETPGQVTNSQVRDRDFKVLLQAEWHRRGIGTGQGSIRGLESGLAWPHVVALLGFLARPREERESDPDFLGFATRVPPT